MAAHRRRDAIPGQKTARLRKPLEGGLPSRASGVNGAGSIRGISGGRIAEPAADHLAALAAFLSSNLHLETMITDLPGAAPVKGHVTRTLFMMMMLVHGGISLGVKGGSHRPSGR